MHHFIEGNKTAEIISLDTIDRNDNIAYPKPGFIGRGILRYISYFQPLVFHVINGKSAIIAGEDLVIITSLFDNNLFPLIVKIKNEMLKQSVAGIACQLTFVKGTFTLLQGHGKRNILNSVATEFNALK